MTNKYVPNSKVLMGDLETSSVVLTESVLLTELSSSSSSSSGAVAPILSGESLALLAVGP